MTEEAQRLPDTTAWYSDDVTGGVQLLCGHCGLISDYQYDEKRKEPGVGNYWVCHGCNLRMYPKEGASW